MRTNEVFLAALRDMSAAVNADYKAKRAWHYTNTKKRYKTFEKARETNRLTNCVDAVQMGLRKAGIPASALGWYGGKGKIVWDSDKARAEALKYFDVVTTGGKTVNQLKSGGHLCDGDILLGYQGMSHTNCYIGGNKSFDAGASEGAAFKRWIFQLKWGSKKVNRILRLKDRAHYRVQAGAYTDIGKYNAQEALVRRKGFPTTMIREDGMYKVQVGYFSGKTNAENLVAKLARNGISAFAKEV